MALSLRLLLGRAVRPVAARLLRPLLPLLSRRDALLFGYRFRNRPDVFHPGLYFSSKILCKFLLDRNLYGKNVLDMGTGSGLIGVLAASRGAAVLSLDVNPSAVSLARENAALNGVQDRMEVRQSDLFSSLTGDRRFDLIAFNPPFYPAQARDDYGRAWYAGEGFAAVRGFLSRVSGFLSPGGSAVVIYSTDMDLDLLSRIASENRLCLVRESIVPHLFEKFLIREYRPIGRTDS